MITPAQCRAARAMLKWSQQGLADRAKVHRATVNTFERSGHRLGPNNLAAIESAFIGAGLELLSSADGKGVGVRFVAAD
jgi:transcriptional regulator with XRE-family HTH domain